jgi:hypothetical protein
MQPGQRAELKGNILRMLLAFRFNTNNMRIMVLIWSQSAGGYLATSSNGVYMAYNSFDCEMELFRWFAVFKRHLSGRFADRHRADFGAFETLKSAQQACENHAQEFAA